MITALMTGLGIGLAFWIITIPTVMLLVKRGTTNDELNKKSLELLEERNRLSDDENMQLDGIKQSLWNICEALLRERK